MKKLFMQLYGLPCIQCGQPANRMTGQRITHVNQSIRDCDAGSRGVPANGKERKHAPT